jgi:flagellum-specific peptidoglycan hydrolase FlgJ
MYYNLIGLLIYTVAVVYVKNVEFNDTTKETLTRGEIITNTVIDTVYIKEKPQQVTKQVKQPAIKKTAEIWAGAAETISGTNYDLNGLPVGRKWLTSKEYKGDHIDALPVTNKQKRLIKERFKTWKSNHIKTFVKWISDAAKVEGKLKNIPPSLIAAAAILESNYGLSRLAVQGRNLYGIKYRGKDKSKFLVVADDTPKDRFHIFPSYWFSIRNYTNVLNARYKSRLKSNNLSGWLCSICGGETVAESKKFVKNGGYVYATSCLNNPQYNKKLLRIIKTYDLQRLDK